MVSITDDQNAYIFVEMRAQSPGIAAQEDRRQFGILADPCVKPSTSRSMPSLGNMASSRPYDNIAATGPRAIYKEFIICFTRP